jgi:antirestriction protein
MTCLRYTTVRSYFDYYIYGFDLGEYPSISELVEAAQFTHEHGHLGAELLMHFNDIEYAKKAMEEHYQGEYTSLEDYAYYLVKGTMEVPENIEPYFDYEKYGRDMELSGDIFIIEIGYRNIHVFWNF